MASVFLSYDRDDAEKARLTASALEKAGHSVWWDLHVRGGAQFGKVIEEALKAAGAVVVLWSKHSIESAWVRDEAAAGRDTGRLVPVTIDGTQPPLGFRQFQTIDLSKWKGRGKPAQLQTLLDDVAATVGSKVEFARAGPVAPETERRRMRAPKLLQSALVLVGLVVLTAVLLLWRSWGSENETPVVAVTAADQMPGSKALAGELLVQLGKVQATNAASLDLVDSASEKPDLILNVGASSQGEVAGASLSLLDANDRVLLWSKDYEQPVDRRGDLRQQLAASSSQVLRCAGEAMRAEGKQLNRELRTLYLKGCAELSEGGDDAAGSIVPMFETVTQRAPRFRPGWAKLLIASSGTASIIQLFGDDAATRALARHIAAAEAHFPDLPEILVAESGLEPALAKHMQLLDEAKRRGPTNPFVLTARAEYLLGVGRMGEAVADADKALRLDPLSPGAHSTYISALTYAAQFARAEEAIVEAERLWPGSSSVMNAKLRFHLRYGDPRIALPLLHKSEAGPAGSVLEAFLRARIDRTPENIERALKLARAGLMRFKDFSFYGQTLAEFGYEEELYSLLERFKGNLLYAGFDVFFRPTFKKFREDPRFMRLAKRAGLVAYWHNSGKWPDFCFDPDLPYDCKKEAVKLADNTTQP